MMSSVPGNGAPKSPANLTPEVVRYLAREEARKEIVATSTALANKVQDVMSKSMGPLNEKFNLMFSEQHKTAVVMNALVEMLVEKKIATQEEIEAKVVAIHEREMARNKEVSERKAAIATSKGPVLEQQAAQEPAKEGP